MQHTFSASPVANPYVMQQPAREAPSIEMSLREHLLAAQTGQQQPVPPSLPSPHEQMHAAPPPGPHEHNIDPAIAGQTYAMSAGDSGGDDTMMSEARKGRRELSTSKRAAQNRAAQRAFRQRKEEYIKSLKDQVREYEQMAEQYKAVQAENYQLRDYIINLQSRLLESQGEYPQPPSNIDLSQPTRGGVDPTMQQMPAPQAPAMASSAVSQLQAAAAAAAQASELNSHGKHSQEEAQYLPPEEYRQPKRSRSEEAGGNSTHVDTSADAGLSTLAQYILTHHGAVTDHTTNSESTGG